MNSADVGRSEPVHMSRSAAGTPGDQEHVPRGRPVGRQNLDVQADRSGNHTRAIEGNVDRSTLKPVRRAGQGVSGSRVRGAGRGQCNGRATSPRRRRRPTEHARVPVPVYASAARYPLRNWSYRGVQKRQRHRFRPRRLGCLRSPARAWHQRGRATASSCSCACRTASIAEVAADDRARPVGRARLGRRRLCGARAASTPLLAPPAADVHARARARAARRGLGGGHVGSRTRRGRSASGSPRHSACSPSSSPDDARPLYHAGAAIASNYLVTLHAVASDLFRAAGAPPEALVPLMRRTIEQRLRADRARSSAVTGRRSRRTAARSAPRGPSSSRCTTSLAEATAK